MSPDSTQPLQTFSNDPLPVHAPEAEEKTMYTPPAKPTAHSETEYKSNPFLVSIKGLVTILRNPVPTLMSSLVAVIGFVAFISLYVYTLAANLAGTDTFSTTIYITIAIVAVLCLLVSTAMNYAVAAASIDGRSIGTKEVLRRAMAKLLPYLVLLILFAAVVIIGGILLIIPGIFLLGRLGLSPIIMFHENVGPIKSLRRSFSMTKGHAIEVFAAQIVGAMLAGYGLLMGACSASPATGWYVQLKNPPIEKRRIHWLNYLIALLVIAYFGVIIYGAIVNRNTSYVTSTPTSNSTTLDLNNTNYLSN